MLTDPVSIAKIIDFVIFAIGVVFVWRKVIAGQLESQQEKQNKEIEDAQLALVEAQAAIENARAALDTAGADSKRMVEFGAAQADRIVTDSKAEAEEHASRVMAHANGELERERYRVRRELLEDTVERAHDQARKIVADELDANRQRALVERLLTDLERSHA
jgi:F-type H+-transporting ATPase subunit b